MKKFTLTSLKRELREKTKEELIKEISLLCKKFPQVKGYYQAQAGDVQEIVAKCKKIIEKEFIDGKTRGLPKARLSVAKKAIRDFNRLVDNVELTAGMMFTYTESVSQFNSRFAPDTEEFYTEPEDMFEEALELLAQHNLLAKFKNRACKIVAGSTEGWGHRDSLQERYEAVYGEQVY
ncbi:MAG: DUF6155 family protein [Candidatus Electrothrix sp. YB6]